MHHIKSSRNNRRLHTVPINNKDKVFNDQKTSHHRQRMRLQQRFLMIPFRSNQQSSHHLVLRDQKSLPARRFQRPLIEGDGNMTTTTLLPFYTDIFPKPLLCRFCACIRNEKSSRVSWNGRLTIGSCDGRSVCCTCR